MNDEDIKILGFMIITLGIFTTIIGIIAITQVPPPRLVGTFPDIHFEYYTSERRTARLVTMIGITIMVIGISTLEYIRDKKKKKSKSINELKPQKILKEKQQIVCTGCNELYDLDVNFDYCKKCGRKIKNFTKNNLRSYGFKVCENCGNPINPEEIDDSEFCKYCGKQL